MLFMFVSYYHRMGWRVVVYDRFGLHWQFIKELLSLPGFDYYPFTGLKSFAHGLGDLVTHLISPPLSLSFRHCSVSAGAADQVQQGLRR